MSDWKPRRFWKTAEAAEIEGGFTVLLDGRQAKTPLKSPLVMPNRGMAEAAAAEWAAQEGDVDPMSMPVTRSVNSAIDKVAPQRAEVAAMLAGYGDSDLLCYRADKPAELVERQQAQWDPALDWAAETLGARLEPRVGVMHRPQAPEALQALSDRVQRMEVFRLTGFHDLVALSGSLILGFAAALDWRAPEEIWRISRLDELWQAEQWGDDDEAEALAEARRQAFLHAKRFHDMA